MVLGRYRRSHPIVIVIALQTAFEADPCVRTTEPLGLVLNSFVPPLVAMNLAPQPEYLEASSCQCIEISALVSTAYLERG
jgi:hypothetical protein